MPDVYDELAVVLKLSKGKIEEAQYATEKARSEYMAYVKAQRACDGHEALIAQLKDSLKQAEESCANLYKDREKLAKKLESVQALLGKA